MGTDTRLFITVSFCLPLFFSNSVTLFLCLIENPSAEGGDPPRLRRHGGEASQYSSYCENNTTETALAHRKSFQTYLLITHIYVNMSTTVSLPMHRTECTEALLKNKPEKNGASMVFFKSRTATDHLHTATLMCLFYAQQLIC